jgi:thiol:disulfide interchange protein
MILPTTILGLGIFSASQWITATPSGPVTLTWYKTEAQAIEAATAEQKPILVDMWAEWCEACKKNGRHHVSGSPRYRQASRSDSVALDPWSRYY